MCDEIDYEALCALAGADGHNSCIVMTYLPMQTAVYVPLNNSDYLPYCGGVEPYPSCFYWQPVRTSLFSRHFYKGHYPSILGRL